MSPIHLTALHQRVSFIISCHDTAPEELRYGGLVSRCNTKLLRHLLLIISKDKKREEPIKKGKANSTERVRF